MDLIQMDFNEIDLNERKLNMKTTVDITKTKELNSEEMDKVSGGTFTPNTYSKDTYHLVGISTRYNFFDKDEFKMMGQAISVDVANDIVSIARNMHSIINGGYHGANQIGYNEPRFIVAFNSQLYPKYGIKWDGVPGSDF
jgi:hypothetical protein